MSTEKSRRTRDQTSRHHFLAASQATGGTSDGRGDTILALSNSGRGRATQPNLGPRRLETISKLGGGFQPMKPSIPQQATR